MITVKSRKANPGKYKSTRRSEISVPARMPQICTPQNGREIEHWLLRAGLSPQASRPMSEIGIYTDFT